MSKRLWVALIAVTLGGGALRFATLDLQSYWIDEIFTARLSAMSFGEMLGDVRRTEASPPLYYTAAWLWAKLFGTGEIGLRSLSALTGTIFIPVAYATAAVLVSRRAGLLTAALAATSPILVWYSQEARSYMPMVLASGLSLLFFARALRQPSVGNLVGWSALSAVAIATHYFAVFIVIAEAFALLVSQKPRRRIVVAMGPIVLVGLLLLPLMREQSINPLWIEDISLRLRAEETVRQLVIPSPVEDRGFAVPDSHELWWVALAVLAVALFFVARFCQPAPRRGALAAFGLGAGAILLPLVLGVAAELVVDRGDYLLARNVLAAWLPLAVVLAAGFGAPRLGAAGIGAIALLCAAGLAVVVAIDSRPEWQRDNWRQVVNELPRSQVVIAIPAFQTHPLRYYDSTLVDADDNGSFVQDVVVIRPQDTGLRPESLPASFNPVAIERSGRLEIITLRSRSPAFLQAQPGRLVRMP